jgi:hypothetical protein
VQTNGQRQPEETIYALDPAQIRVNDIVLTSRAHLVASIVRARTSSNFSHAALCTRPGMLFEAVPGGVMRRSVIGTYVTHPEWVKVLRPRHALGVNSHGLQVAQYAERMYGRAYSIVRAVASVVDWIDIADDGSVFCSRVIAEAFRDYGVDLLPGTHPSKVYPSMLVDSMLLVDVSDTSVRTLGSKSQSHLFEEVVATAAEELPGDEMQMNRQVFTAIRRSLGNRFPSVVVSLPELWDWLAANSERARAVDPEILATLQSQGFVDWYKGWAEDVEGKAQLFENIAGLAERASKEPMPPDMDEFVQQYGEYLALSETSLLGRKDTMERFARMATETGLSTLIYFSDKYRREHAIFSRLHRANLRLFQAMTKMVT